MLNLSHVYHPIPSPEQGAALIAAALDAGVDHFDTAALYGFGANEDLLGATLGSRRADITLASKCGMYRREGKRVIDGAPESIRRLCDEALTRLRTDVIDLYPQATSTRRPSPRPGEYPPVGKTVGRV